MKIYENATAEIVYVAITDINGEHVGAYPIALKPGEFLELTAAETEAKSVTIQADWLELKI